MRVGMTIDVNYTPSKPEIKIKAPVVKKSKHNKARSLRFKAKHKR